MRPFQTRMTGLILAPLTVAAVGLVASAAQAACSWKFDWYCSGCAKIDGRTTGEQGGYATEAACESARSSVRSPMTTMSCDRVGTCEAPPPRQRQSQDGGSRPRTYQAGPDHAAQAAAEAEEARLAAQRDREAREKKAFENAKADLLGQLKGGTLDQDSGLKGGGGETLKLKSGTPAFGLKGNPGGELRLKDAPAASIPDPETAAVDPAFFTRPKARLRIRAVPNPLTAPRGTWLRYVKSDRAGLVLDALQAGQGDLDRAIAYLDGQIVQHGTHIKASSALSYLEGLKTSYIASGEEYRKLAKSPFAPTTLDSQALLNAIVGPSGPRSWPGPENPDPQVNKNDWRVQRTTAVLQALEENPGDLEAAFDRLKAARDRETAENAEHYLRGVYAYWDFLGREGTK